MASEDFLKPNFFNTKKYKTENFNSSSTRPPAKKPINKASLISFSLEKVLSINEFNSPAGSVINTPAIKTFIIIFLSILNFSDK